jgi:hypothetical protein
MVFLVICMAFSRRPLYIFNRLALSLPAAAAIQVDSLPAPNRLIG